MALSINYSVIIIPAARSGRFTGLKMLLRASGDVLGSFYGKTE